MFSLGLGYRERSCGRNYFLNETKKVRNIPLLGWTSLAPLWALHCYSMTRKLSLANLFVSAGVNANARSHSD